MTWIWNHTFNNYIHDLKLNKHFDQYPLEFIDQNIVKFYKNTGLLTAAGVLVFASIYDINNLTEISINLKKHILSNIEIINKNVHKDLNNTIINYNNKKRILLK